MNYIVLFSISNIRILICLDQFINIVFYMSGVIMGFVICFWLVPGVHLIVTLVNEITPSTASAAFYTLQATSTHVVAITGQPSKSITINYFPASSLTVPVNLPIPGQILDEPAQLRTAEFNTYANIAGTSLLYFNTTRLLFFPNYSPTNSEIYRVPVASQLIRDACFGRIKGHVYLLVEDTTLGAYSIIAVDSSTLAVSSTQLAINTTVNRPDEFRFDSNRLILLFSGRLDIYSCVDLVLGATLFSVNFTNTSTDNTDFKLHNDLLIYSVGTQLFMYNLTTATYSLTSTLPTLIESITRLPNNILIKTLSTIYQFDIQLNKSVQTFLITYKSAGLERIYMMDNGEIVTIGNYKNYYTLVFQVLNVSENYACLGCTTCMTYYVLNGSTCTKTPIPPTTPSNTTTPNLTQNSTQNTTNTQNVTLNYTTNTTTNTTSNITIITVTNSSINLTANQVTGNFSDFGVIYPGSQGGQKIQTGYIKVTSRILTVLASETVGYTISISTFRIMPKFLLIFTLFINDLTLYKTHRKFGPEYPNSTLIFMEKCDLMKELGLDSFETLFPFLNDASDFFSSDNDRLKQQLRLTDHDPQGLYFLFSISGFYLSSAFMNVLYFLLFKAVHLLLFLLRHQHWFFRKGYRFVRVQTRWWTLLVAVIELNAVDLVFASGLSSLQQSSDCFSSKLSLVSMHLTLFAVMLYSLCFYSIVYAQEKRKCSKNLVIYSKQRMKSYLFQPILFLVRSILKSYVHAYFLFSYSVQIVLLFVIDVPFVALCLHMRNSFRSRLIFVLVTSYMLGFSLFDLYFILEEHSSLTVSWDRELIGYILCAFVAVTSLLVSLTLFWQALAQIYKFTKKSIKSNKVHFVQQDKTQMQNPSTSNHSKIIQRINPANFSSYHTENSSNFNTNTEFQPQPVFPKTGINFTKKIQSPNANPNPKNQKKYNKIHERYKLIVTHKNIQEKCEEIVKIRLRSRKDEEGGR